MRRRWSDALAGCDVLVHCVAGDAKTIVGAAGPAYAAAQRAGVRRLVYLSSGSVHGQAPAAGTDETTPLRDDQPIAYNNAKVRAERQLQKLRATGDVELVILRPGIVTGPRSYWVDELRVGVGRRHCVAGERRPGHLQQSLCR